ncbi:MAG: di-heme oxidoredictase family protein [Pseudomonadota bacterium]
MPQAEVQRSMQAQTKVQWHWVLLAVAACATAASIRIEPAEPDFELADHHLNIVPRTAAETARIAGVTAMPDQFDAPQPFEDRSGGAATVFRYQARRPFSEISANIPFEDELDFRVGRGLFKKLWVSAPASTRASDGLGPLYNARSCMQCHLQDGRGHPPIGPHDNAVSMLMRVSVPSDHTPRIPGSPPHRPHPVYGSQIQDFSLAGVPAEARIAVTWEEEEIALSGGETARLRRPIWSAEDLAYGPLGDAAMLSPRVAPQLIGLGLLEAIPVEDILAGADPEDADGDGVSGRANIVWSVEYDRPMLGRFGHKASVPTIREQAAGAFSGDMGLSTTLFPDNHGECTGRQRACRIARHGGDPVEVSDTALDVTTFYVSNLAVPARRAMDDGEVLRGKQIFHQAGCAACHRPSFVTHRLQDRDEHSFQLIWPYSDLLLHDMGPGLADGRPEGRADGREWRTPPLWGIGLTEQVSGHTQFLHDGRARSLLEAVLWHGGEAQAARDRVVSMPPPDRAALIRFLESL